MRRLWFCVIGWMGWIVRRMYKEKERGLGTLSRSQASQVSAIWSLMNTIFYFLLKRNKNIENYHHLFLRVFKSFSSHMQKSLKSFSALLYVCCYPWYLILSTSVSFFRLLLKTQESTNCNRPTKKIIIKIGTIGTW